MPPTLTTNVSEPCVLSETFYDETTGDVTDPASVSLHVYNPAGVLTTIAAGALTHVALSGVYRYTLIPGVSIAGGAGVWRYQFDGGTSSDKEWGYVVVDQGPRSTLCGTWAELTDLEGCGGDLGTADAGTKRRMLEAASDLLWRWTGFRYGGICRDTIRPTAQRTEVDGSGRASQMQVQTSWWPWQESWGYCACQSSPHRDGCGCQVLSQITLGRVPIRGIVEVRVDGAVVPATSYQVHDDQWLVRTDDDVWPCCQDLTANPATDDDTFQVDFLWGKTPPPSGVNACVALAGDFVRACSGGDCALPSEVQTLVRQGTTLNFQQVGTLFTRDRFTNQVKTGIKVVDAFLSAYPAGRPGMLVVPTDRPDGVVVR